MHTYWTENIKITLLDLIKNGTLRQGNNNDPNDTFSNNQSIIETLNSDSVELFDKFDWI